MSIRILVVEDETNIADFLVRGLREEGYVVEHAGDGATAWHALRTGEWDLVLLDWWLPDQDGLGLLQRFRQSGRSTPVLFLTARDAVSDRVRGLDAGADDYLAKPFAFEELLARVRALVRRRDLAEGTHGFVSRSARRPGDRASRAQRASLSLTAKEHSLLVFFLRHRGQVLSRTRIYDHVWSERYDGYSNTLEVHVKELRRKLEAHGDRLIHTLRGRGYLLGEEPGAPEGSRNEPGGAGMRLFSGDARGGAGRGVGDVVSAFERRTCTGTSTSGWVWRSMRSRRRSTWTRAGSSGTWVRGPKLWWCIRTKTRCSGWWPTMLGATVDRTWDVEPADLAALAKLAPSSGIRTKRTPTVEEGAGVLR